MFEQAITSLAIIKVNWDRGNDYIENFVPFVAECLRSTPQEEVSLPEIQREITHSFSLKIPQGALKTVLQRCCKHGFVNREKGIYIRNSEALTDLGLGRVRGNVLRQHEALIKKLIDFCEKEYGIAWQREEAESAIFTYLEKYSTPVLATVVDTKPPCMGHGKGGRHSDFLVNAFIKELLRRDPEGFEYLETVLKGSMLANVFYFPDLGRVEQHFKQVEVYFDSVFLLRALGYFGESLQAPCRELVDIAYEQGAKLRCFKHTKEEILGILNAAVRVLRSKHLKPTHGGVIEYFVRSDYTASDVELIIAKLPKLLRAFHVRVKSKPRHKASLTIDETKLEATLDEKVGYNNPRAKYRDIDSLAAIYRLRRGSFPLYLEDCNAIFITTNPTLVRAADCFFKEEYEGYQETVPISILDHHLTTISWLKKPLEAPDLPRKRIIADCYAALNPSDTLWKMYLEEINKLHNQDDISKEDYYLLRYSTESRKILMDITQGDADAFIEGTVKEVLEKSRQAARAETEAALHNEKKKREETERQAERAQARLKAQQEHLQILSEQIGRWVTSFIEGGWIIMLSLGVFLTFPKPSPTMPEGWWELLSPAALLIFGILTVGNLVFGTTVGSLVRRLEIRISRLVERTLIQYTLDDVDEPPN